MLTGTLGSYMNETWGWASVFYSIGFIALLWVAVLKYYAMRLTSQKEVIVGISSSLPRSNSVSDNHVPWLTYLSSPALWYIGYFSNGKSSLIKAFLYFSGLACFATSAKIIVSLFCYHGCPLISMTIFLKLKVGFLTLFLGC